MISKLLKSRTIRFSLLLAIFGVVENNFSLFADTIGPTWYPSLFVLVGIATAILRILTTQSIQEK